MVLTGYSVKDCYYDVLHLTAYYYCDNILML